MMESEFCELNNNFPEDERFQRMIREAEKSIEEGNLPLRISQGSSGSYFVRDCQDVRKNFHSQSNVTIFL